jgi:hypothetical protein
MDKELFSSKLIGKRSKTKIRITTVGPMVTCGAETCTLSGRGVNYLTIFERRILRKFFGPLQERDGWRICTNRELNKLIGGANVLMFVTAK